jgi:hypothetical protein
MLETPPQRKLKVCQISSPSAYSILATAGSVRQKITVQVGLGKKQDPIFKISAGGVAPNLLLPKKTPNQPTGHANFKEEL